MALKRYRNKDFYEICIRNYIDNPQCFLNKNTQTPLTKFSVNEAQRNDLLLTLGALIYKKELNNFKNITQ
jgi:hypothetical protein